MLTNTKFEKLKNDLRSAVREENFQKVKEYVKKTRIAEAYILKSNVIINSKDQNGNSPLSIAVNKKNLGITKFLIVNGADVNIRDYFNLPPIYYAVRHCTIKMIELLIDEGAGIGDYFLCAEEARTLVGWAIYDNSLEKVEVLLKRSASPNSKFDLYDDSQDTCLHAAVRKNHLKIVELLVKYHADINVQNEQGNTPMHLAISFQHTQIIKLLYDNNADINIKNKEGKTPLDLDKYYYKDDATQSTSVPSSAVRPSSFINSAVSHLKDSTTTVVNGLCKSIISAQQHVAYSAGGSISSSQVNGTVLLVDVIVKMFTGEKIFRTGPFLTRKEREISAVERDLNEAISKFEKLNQCPGSLLNNATISKSIDHQKFFNK
ncbi:ankyrin repeat domain-containing protein [Wolbachia endosymbiont of Tribolium confusum]|uniref:ankyrin repeat domain-containing protein n=1 Tax=Wolbachia endosymbiont of Tribolium confusum TaxID=214474 RepID=UPI001CF56869|nr:ankyrin repeat domain-containing protein [Wolbachia endosymbiont of Tribolium confusum]MCA7010761.1 ankyrin repeat domain-containing protein [Wolbachia endosymbiont of Tribolium confusum]